ncbi:MAG: HEAT repeat domain-containing protein [Blastocatellia bacterium]|nr:HEAT repeat domain-containing protein [Blastocatellia bacterium]
MKAIEMILSQPVVEALGWALLHFVWQGALVAVVLALFMGLLRRRSANLRYLVACSAMLLMLILPIATIWFMYAPSQQAAPIETLISPSTSRESSALAAPLPSGNRPTGSALAPLPPSWQERLYERVEPSLPWLIAVWLVGVFALSLRLLGGWATTQYLKKRRTNPVREQLQEKLSDLCLKLRVTRTVRLLESAWVRVPTVIGWLRPVILLPASALTGLAPNQLEAILAHELAHIRRHDYLINLIQTVIETLLFYHPAVWWVSRRIRAERENCCDDAAVALCGDALVYARALTELEHLRSAEPQLAMAATGGALLERIRRLAGVPSPKSNRFAGLLAGAVVILVLITVGAGAQMSLDSNQSENGDHPTVAEEKENLASDKAGVISPLKSFDEWADLLQFGDEGETDEAAQTVSQEEGAEAQERNLYAAQTEQDQDADANPDVDMDSDKDGDQDQQASGQETAAQKQELKSRIVDAFIMALKDEDAGVRQQAASSLGSSGDPRAVEPLMAAARDANSHVRQQAIASLGDLSDKRAVDIVLTALKDESPHVRQQAAAALGDLRDGRAVDPLIAALKDENTHVRQQVVAALGDLGDKRAVEGVILALKDENPHVRQQAAASLGDLRDPRALMPLIAAAKDANPYVRSQVISALGDLGDSRAVDVLIAALKDGNAYVRKQAAAALAEIR